ncbi:MAG: S26 family signal peptidase [Thermoplasmata archaeon]
MDKSVQKDCISNKVFMLTILLLIALVGIFGYIEKHIMITLTPSVNHRIFWYNIHKFNENDIKLGSYVMFRVPKSAQLYKYDVVTKIDMCDSGDYLKTIYYPKLNVSYYYCNGKYLGNSLPYAEPKKGEKIKLNSFFFNGIIPKDYFFAMGNLSISYDSRYWGLINKNSVISIVKPIL